MRAGYKQSVVWQQRARTINPKNKPDHQQKQRYATFVSTNFCFIDVTGNGKTEFGEVTSVLIWL